jgi:hypothetical protein
MAGIRDADFRDYPLEVRGRSKCSVSERLTGALLDRLTHHVHILEMNGESYRLAQSKRRRRVISSSADTRSPAAQ